MPRTLRRLDEYAILCRLILAGLEITHDLCVRLARGTLFALRCCLAASFVVGTLVRLLATAAWRHTHHRDREAVLASCRAVRALPVRLHAGYRRLRRGYDLLEGWLVDTALPVLGCLLVRAVRAVLSRLHGPDPVPLGVLERRGALRAEPWRRERRAAA